MRKPYLPILILVFAVLFSTTTQGQVKDNPDLTQKSKTVDELLKSGDKKITARKYKEALEDFNKAVELDPYSADIYNYRGMTKYFLEDYKGALADFDKTIELQPDYAEAYNLRGVVKGELNDEKGACEDWEKAFELGFKNAFVLLKKFCQEKF